METHSRTETQPEHQQPPIHLHMKLLSAINVRLRLRTLVLTVLLALLVTSFVYSHRNSPPSQQVQPLDVVKARKSFTNPIYAKWAGTDRLGKSVQDNCVLYFNEFQAWSNKKDDYLFEDLLSYQFSPLLYKESKWLAEEKKQYRRQLRQQGILFDDSHMRFLEQKYLAELVKLSKFERGFIQNTASLRVFGKCFMAQDVHIDDSSCSQISSRLLPWLLGNLPSIESWESNVVKEDDARLCVAKLILKKMKGRGIVIPLLPKENAAKQTMLVARLIHTLRAKQNTLPIEIVYVEEGEINKQRKETFVNAARSRSVKLPTSVKDYLETNDLQNVELPQQDVRFVNLRPAIAKTVPVSDSLMWSLAAVFNSFEEMIMLSAQTIPLMEDLLLLFENDDYRETGNFFFKHRSLMNFKPHKFPSGFFEVNSLVNDYADVLADDYKYFKMVKADFAATKRVRDQGFTRLLDPSMAVINKRKSLPGLLMASALTFCKVLQPKYDFSGELNLEGVWLGIEMMAGQVHFNRHYAAAVGVMTPPENTPPESMARELCSSSWAQVYETDDYTLVYLTSHQLENKVLPEFTSAVVERLTVKTGKIQNSQEGKEAEDAGTAGDNLAPMAVKRNLLYLKSALLPIAIELQETHSVTEPNSPWRLIDGFGSSDDYWCAYDVVGSVNLPSRGVVIDYNEKITSRYLFLFEMWLQAPQVHNSK